MESIKDKVAIVGMGCSEFGELWNKDADDLIVEAAYEAYQDAGIEPKDIQAAWLGTFDSGRTGSLLASPLQLQYIPVSRVENLCATGIEALRHAAFALAAKVYDLVLVVGVEKLKDRGFGGLGGGTPPGKSHPVFTGEMTAPGRFALSATAYFSKYGLSMEEGKRTLAKIAVKSHYNGARNPRAHLRREVTVEEVMNAPVIAWPLGLYDCCGVTDGAAAAILCRTEDAKSFRDDYVTIKGVGLSVGPGWGREKTSYDFTFWDETAYAAKQAYEMAGIKSPRTELDMVELHDCFSIAELIAYESLFLCERGKARQDVDAGTFTQEGEVPVNLSGGLKSFGHPIGASGCREAYEVYKQIQGKAELPSRQLKNVQLGLTHNQGGVPGKFEAGVCILGAP